MAYDEIDLYSGLAALHWSAYDDPAWDHDFYRHLLPGGVLAFNAYWGDWGDFDYNDPARERLYPSDWRPHVVKEWGGQRRLVVERRTTGVDPIEQVVSEQRRYRLYDGDDLLQEEAHAGQNHWYFKKEMLLMLQPLECPEVVEPVFPRINCTME